MKRYSRASDDVFRHIEQVRADWYSPYLDDVSIDALFVFDDESTLPVLKHGGYPAQALCRITSVRQRVLGIADVVITIDRANWLNLHAEERAALIDHELCHVERVVNKKGGGFQIDGADRPKLKIRPHDRQYGWFDEVAQRHGDASPEVRQAKQLIASAGQLYLDFSGRKVAA